MNLEDTARLRDFTRLIALGYPPSLAAMHAGYSNMRASRAATRLAPRPAGGEPEGPRAAERETQPADEAQVAQPVRRPPPPMPTVREWAAKLGWPARRAKVARE